MIAEYEPEYKINLVWDGEPKTPVQQIQIYLQCCTRLYADTLVQTRLKAMVTYHHFKKKKKIYVI
jgi:hypothetical protein